MFIPVEIDRYHLNFDFDVEFNGREKGKRWSEPIASESGPKCRYQLEVGHVEYLVVGHCAGRSFETQNLILISYTIRCLFVVWKIAYTLDLNRIFEISRRFVAIVTYHR